MEKIFFTGKIIITCLILITSSAFSQQNIWTKIGSTFGSPIATIACDSQNNILVGTSSEIMRESVGKGIWKSSNLGKTWNPINNGLPNLNVYDILVLPTGEILAAADRRIFRSADNGEHWIQTDASDSGLDNLALSAKGTLFANDFHGTLYKSEDFGKSWKLISLPDSIRIFQRARFKRSGEIFVGSGGGEFIRSTDEGETWRRDKITGIKNRGEFTIIVPCKNQLFACTAGDGLFYSTDDGSSWMKTRLPAAYIRDINIDREGNLLACTFNPPSLYESNDDGLTWNDIGLKEVDVQKMIFLPDRIIALGSCGSGSSLLQSMNHGVTWQQIAYDFGGITSLQSDSKQWLYAGTEWCGLARSSDMGNTWSFLNGEVYDVNDIVAKSNGTIIVGYNVGFMGSTDDGKTWAHLFTKGLTDSTSRSLYLGTDGSVYACAEYKYVGRIDSGGGGLFVSKNDGRVWNRVEVKDTSLHERMNVTIKGWKDQTPVYAIRADNEANLYACAEHEGALFKSTNKGQSWKKLGYKKENSIHNEIRSMEFGPDKEIYLASDYNGFYESTDGGASFFQVMNGLGSRQIERLLTFQNIGLLAATGNGVYFLQNHGNTWYPVAFPHHSVKAMAQFGDYFFVSINGFEDSANGLYRAKMADFLATLPQKPIEPDVWTEVGNPSGNEIKKFSIDRQGHLFALAGFFWGDTLFCSRDHGKSWNRCNDPIATKMAKDKEGLYDIFPKHKLLEFAIDDDKHSLFILMSDSIYESKDEGTTWQTVSAIPLKFGDDVWKQPRIKSFLVVRNQMFIVAEASDAKEVFGYDTTAKWLGAFYAAGMGNRPGMIYRSSDGGVHWITSAKALPPPSGTLFLDTDGLLYAGTHSGIYLSNDTGYTWEAMNEGLLKKNAVYTCNIGADIDRTVTFISTFKNGQIFAAKGGQNFQSSDKGRHWSSMEGDLSIGKILSIGNKQLVATASTGIFISNDAGTSWLPFSSGLTSADIEYIERDSDGYLYAVSSDGHFFRTVKSLDIH